MPLIPLLIGSSTVLGMSYFCVDLYRNRRKLAEKPGPEVDLTCYEFGDIPNGKDFQAVGDAIGQAGHGMVETSSEYASGSIGHCVEAIGHVISHH